MGLCVVAALVVGAPLVVKALTIGAQALSSAARAMSEGMLALAANNHPAAWAPTGKDEGSATSLSDSAGADGPVAAHSAGSVSQLGAPRAGAPKDRSATDPQEPALRRQAPTPVFAVSSGLRLRLPVEADRLTVIGYHQATNPEARSLRAVAAVRNTYGAVPFEGFAPAIPETIDNLTMWRTGRSGPPNRAADIGAPAGSTVLSPVDGTIAELRPYMLYGVTPDIEVHIAPTGVGSVEVVIIHMDTLRVRQGDKVVAGLTPLGKIRRLSRRLRLQLGYFSHEAGDHVHLQVNTPSAKPGPHAYD